MERILTSIDVGTSKVCTTVVRMKNKDIAQVLGTGIVPSHGIHKAIVLDISEPTAAIRDSVKEAERSSGIEVKSAYVGITGEHIASFNNQGTTTVTRRDHLVTRKDLDQAIKSSRQVTLPQDRKLIHAIPRQYRLDNEPVIGDPVGLHGHNLAVETHIVTAGITFIQNLVKCVQGTGVNVMDLILEPLAASEAVLEAGEKEAGVVLADIGAGTTDITVFKEQAIWHSDALPVGGYQMTRDIAMGLGIPFNVAEELKVKYGSARPKGKDMPEIVSLDPGGKYGVHYKDLCYIVTSRAEEVIRMVFLNLPRAEWETWEPTTLVLTGGTAKLPGIEALGREILRVPVRVGKPKGLPEGAVILDDPAYAVGVGLLLWGARYGQPSATTPEGVIRRFFDQLRRWWFTFPKIRISIGK